MGKTRKALSAKTRFEVFKRDGFKCQYCGASAPETVLHVDHVVAVANGGKNSMLNLVTSCQPCNGGKGARPLNDSSAVEKQRRQMEELSERREQLDMLLAWRSGLDDIGKRTERALVERVQMVSGFTLNARGKEICRKYLRKYPLPELFDAIDGSAFYLELGLDGKFTKESFEKFFSYIPKVASCKRSEKEEPYLKDMFYIRGILRNRINFTWVAQRDCLPLLKRAIDAGVSIKDDLERYAKQTGSWTDFEDVVEKWIKELEEQEQPRKQA